MGLSLWMQPVGAQTLPEFRLTQTQEKALGLVTRPVEAEVTLQQGGLPGVLVVPHEHMRLLSVPFGGMVESVYGAPGMAVKRGQWLFRMSVPQALELRRDQVQVEAQHQLAQQNLQRDERLFAEGVIAEARLQATRAAARQSEAQWLERQDALRTSGLVPIGQGLFELRAPFDGILLSHDVQVGQRVEGGALLGKLGRLSSLWVDMRVTPGVASMLKAGQAIELTGTKVVGKLLAVGRAADASQTIFVRGLIDNKAERLVPGQAVEVSVQGLSLQQEGGRRVPATAIVRQEGADYLFVERRSDAQGRVFAPLAVRVLGANADRALVQPLDVGQRDWVQHPIVVSGASGLKALWVGVGRD